MVSLVTVGSFSSSLLHLVDCNMTLLIKSFLISGGFIMGWHIRFIPFRKLILWSWAPTCSPSVTFVSSTLKHPSSSHYQLAHCLVFCCHCFTLPCSTKLSFSFFFMISSMWITLLVRNLSCHFILHTERSKNCWKFLQMSTQISVTCSKKCAMKLTFNLLDCSYHQCYISNIDYS